MNVTFHAISDKLASTRLRALIPQAELAKLGVEKGPDILVMGKHGWRWKDLPQTKIVFDVCDDHFHHPIHAPHYFEGCEKAAAVTCSTPGLRDIIKAATGRDATVIAEPYEQPEKAPRIGQNLLWFGHWLNIGDLHRELPGLARYPLRVVTNAPADDPLVWQWSPEAMDRAFDEAGLVIIPTGEKTAKSANRAVESIRRGLFVVANPLPAYAQLGVWLGDIKEGIEWALSHQDEAISRIRSAQRYVRSEFSPQRIAMQWMDLLESL